MNKWLNHPWFGSKQALFFIPFLIALVTRFLFYLLDIPDYLGDAFHSWMISVATIENDWIYSDYKGRELVWLPFHRYLVSVFMIIFSSYDMAVTDALNILLGAITCGVISLITNRLSNRQMGLFAGITLALTPSHVSYSNINTPEILAGLILSLVVYVALFKKSFWLLPLVFIGVLTKNELTMLLVMFGGLLVLHGNWRPSLFMVAGGLLGLGVWMWWCYNQTGYPFFWLTERAAGSRWDHLFQVAKGSYSYDLGKYSHYIERTFPFIVVIPVIIWLCWDKVKSTLRQKRTRLVILVVWSHWIFIFFMAFYFFPTLSIRYFLFTLPLAISMLFIWLHELHGIKKKGLYLAVIIILLAAIFRQYPNAHFRRYSYAPPREVGKFIEQMSPVEGNFWIDFPVAIYYSGLPLDSFYSGKQIFVNSDPDQQWTTNLYNQLKEKRINYIMSAPVSYSRVLNIWPQMKTREPFEWMGIWFEPVFRYDPSEHLIEEEWWWDARRNNITKRQSNATLWKLKTDYKRFNE